MQSNFISYCQTRQKVSPILSGTMDIIVCLQDDGKLRSTNFSILIGKLELYKPSKENIVFLSNYSLDGKQILETSVFIIVTLNINGETLNEVMYLNMATGKAYFKILNEKQETLLVEQPSNEILQQMNLKFGLNHLTYSFQDQNQINTISSRIFRITNHHKIVISDIDGTVTKSDFLGHVMDILKKDWSHNDICCLFNKFIERGYFIVYLTARSVTQYSKTLELLQRIDQDGIKLPEGPILLNEQTLFEAFKTELIYKTSNEIKIKLLKLIESIFDLSAGSCFSAGFGNRSNDAIAYRNLGLPFSKIFLINKNSVVYQLDNQNQISYRILFDKFDQYFYQNYNEKFLDMAKMLKILTLKKQISL